VTDEADSATPRRRSTSGPAVLGTLVAVAIAVLVGVFGPDLGRRGIAPEGIPLGAAVERLGEVHRGRIAPENVAAERWREAARALGAIRVPEPPAEVWTYRGARIDEGNRGRGDGLGPVVVATFERSVEDGLGPVRLSVAAVADGGEFHRYDGFVRSTPLLDGEVLRFSAEETTNGVAVLVFVDDPIVWIVHCDDDEVLEAVADDLLGRPTVEPEDPAPRRVRAPNRGSGKVPGRVRAEGGDSGLELPILRPYA